MPPTTPPLKQLKHMNLRDISKLDIKDLQKIDYLSFAKDIAKTPDKLIIFLAPVLAVFAGFNVFSRSQAELKAMAADTVQMQEKTGLVSEYKIAQEELQKFLDSTPKKISETEFTDKITELAVKRGVQIESFSPAKNQSDPLFDLILININVNAKDYENIWLFIHDIETSGLNIRINSWTGSMGSRSQQSIAFRRAREALNLDDAVINVRLDIATVSFKTEK